MRRELRHGLHGLTGLRRGPLLRLALWSLPEALPAAVSGFAVAHAVDDGFLARRPEIGAAWLGVIVLTSLVGAAGARRVYTHLGALVEPFRDDLVRRVVGGALRSAVAGRPDDGAVSRLTHQVEIVRDSYAGVIVLLRTFLVAVAGAVAGLLSVAPVLLWLVLPPFLLGLAGLVASLRPGVLRQRAYVATDEALSTATGSVLAGLRDLAAGPGRDGALAMVGGPVEAQAAAERAAARAAVLRGLSFAAGGWLPLLAVLAAGPWLLGRGLSTGAVLGGLLYVLRGLQPALGAVAQGLGGSGLRFVVTLGRILDAAPDTRPEPAGTPVTPDPGGPVALRLRSVRFAYGPDAEPVLRGLDLDVRPGEHLAIIGPSGIGKSTLAGLLCGLLAPDGGDVRLEGRLDGCLDGCPVHLVPPAELARSRVLIPQEAYVFGGTVWDNLTYLRPDAGGAEVDAAVSALAAGRLVDRLGGYAARLEPATLSAGERQLVALTRAFLSPAPLAVLDEATCHLDAAHERLVEEAFAARPGSLVVIAHRLSSARRAGRVLLLDGDEVLLGTHEELLGDSALYRELFGLWSGSPVAAQIQPAS